MSIARVVLVVVEAVCNQLACTPPNPTPSKGRYHTDELYILQIAPFVFWCHQLFAWTCAVFETVVYLQSLVPHIPALPVQPIALVCPAAQPHVRLTPFFIIGALAVVLGAYIRLDCFHTLGTMFTFDLTVHPEHRLVTRRFYAYVRHPAYTGSLLLVFGLALSHLTRGSWMTECGPLRHQHVAHLVWALWWIWTVSVGLSRVQAEDAQMQKLFQAEWDAYAAQVQWWFLPGLL